MEEHTSDKAMWEELDSYLPGDPPLLQTQLESIGMTATVLEQLNRRGIIFTGFTDQRKPQAEIRDESLASRFREKFMNEDGISVAEREKRWLRFYRDACTEADDERFRMQWPELF